MNYINPKDKVFWHLEELNQLKQGFTKYPINVEIDLTNRCNHGCSWCHFAYTHTKGPLANSKKPLGYIDTGDVFDYELLLDVITQLKNIGVKSITWTGGGEPTLYPKIIDVLAYTSYIGLEQGIYTNGSFINEELAKYLKQHCTFVYISLDESNAEDFKQSKGVTRFNKVIEGIKHLVSAEGKATIGIGFLLHENNYFKLNQMKALGESLKVDYIQFRPTIHYDVDNPSLKISHPSWIDSLEEQPETIVFDKSRFDGYLNWNGHGYKTCNWSALQTVITPNGKVWTCVNKRGIESALLGDLTTQSFKDIWKGKSCLVDNKCRIMCRGHLANQSLDKIMTKPDHSNFV